MFHILYCEDEQIVIRFYDSYFFHTNNLVLDGPDGLTCGAQVARKGRSNAPTFHQSYMGIDV